MDAREIRRLEPRLARFLGEFDDCIKTCLSREHFSTYVRGQLSDLPRKSVEPIALWAKTAPRNLQEFLSLHRWNEDMMRIRIGERVASNHACAHSIGILDETGCPKKGKETPGVQRQWCGATGKTDNCVVTVHLGYAADDFHCLLDSELFLPESWDADRERCRKAGIPDNIVYRPKWKIGLELLDRTKATGVELEWLGFDEGYGGKTEFLKNLIDRGQPFVGEIPKTSTGWFDMPSVTERVYGTNRRGRRRRLPRLTAGSKKARSVESFFEKELQGIAWTRYRIKDTMQGPFVWEVKSVGFHLKVGDLPEPEPLTLIVARNVLNPKEIKFFLAYNPREHSFEEILKVAFSRWRVERCFEDEKTELGFDHYEGRKYRGLIRHQRITAVTHLFLAEEAQRMKKKTRTSRSAKSAQSSKPSLNPGPWLERLVTTF